MSISIEMLEDTQKLSSIHVARMKHSHTSTVGRIKRLTGQLSLLTKIRTVLLTSAGMFLITGCAGIEPRQPLPTVDSVNLARYVGTWYEIARLPMWFQRHCVDSKAVYTILPNTRIGVHNECVTDSGTLDQVDGVATVVDPTTNARLAVTFDNFFARLVGPSRQGNYWILDLDPDYQVAMVGTPDRRYLWILSRSPHLDMPTYQRLITKAQNLGFPVSNLIKAQRPNGSSTSSCGFSA